MSMRSGNAANFKANMAKVETVGIFVVEGQEFLATVEDCNDFGFKYVFYGPREVPDWNVLCKPNDREVAEYIKRKSKI